MSDVELIERLKSLAANERQATVQLVAHSRNWTTGGYISGQGCSSLFTYCTQVLHLSAHAPTVESKRRARRGGSRCSSMPSRVVPST